MAFGKLLGYTLSNPGGMYVRTPHCRPCVLHIAAGRFFPGPDTRTSRVWPGRSADSAAELLRLSWPVPANQRAAARPEEFRHEDGPTVGGARIEREQLCLPPPRRFPVRDA